MGMELLSFVIRIGLKFFICLLLIRCWMIAFRLPFRHPLGEFVQLCTNWLTRPFEGKSINHTRFVVIPLILSWILQFLLLELLGAIHHVRTLSPSFHEHIILMSILEWCRMAISIGMAAIIFQAILSWVNPMAPMMGFLMQFTDPLLRPLRKMVPVIGRIDITPLIAILIGSIALYLIDSLALKSSILI